MKGEPPHLLPLKTDLTYRHHTTPLPHQPSRLHLHSTQKPPPIKPPENRPPTAPHIPTAASASPPLHGLVTDPPPHNLEPPKFTPPEQPPITTRTTTHGSVEVE